MLLWQLKLSPSGHTNARRARVSKLCPYCSKPYEKPNVSVRLLEGEMRLRGMFLAYAAGGP